MFFRPLVICLRTSAIHAAFSSDHVRCLEDAVGEYTSDLHLMFLDVLCKVDECAGECTISSARDLNTLCEKDIVAYDGTLKLNARIKSFKI